MENDDLTLPTDPVAEGDSAEDAAPELGTDLGADLGADLGGDLGADLGADLGGDLAAGGELPDLGVEGELDDGAIDLTLDGGESDPAPDALLPDLGMEADVPDMAPDMAMAAAPPAMAEPVAARAVAAAPPAPASGGLSDEEVVNIGAIHSIKVNVQAVLGGVSMPISKLMSLKKDDVVSLDSKLGSAIDLLANGQLIARGEIVVLEEDDDEPRFGITLTEVVAAARSAK